jgi:hypothetical protein
MCNNFLKLNYYPVQLNGLYTSTKYSHNKHLTYLQNFKCSQTNKNPNQLNNTY